jgi:hypothetical protein
MKLSRAVLPPEQSISPYFLPALPYIAKQSAGPEAGVITVVRGSSSQPTEQMDKLRQPLGIWAMLACNSFRPDVPRMCIFSAPPPYKLPVSIMNRASVCGKISDGQIGGSTALLQKVVSIRGRTGD